MTRGSLTIAVVLLVALVLVVISCAPKAEPGTTPTDYYQGKTIEIIACDDPGGDTDLLARLAASYLSGDFDAKVIVSNREGAGGLEGMNYTYKATPDGLTIAVVSSGKFVGNMVMDEPAADYDLGKFEYIMGIGLLQRYFFVAPDGPYQSVADLQTAKDFKIGGGSPSGGVSLGGMSIIKVLGLDTKVVTGVKGRALATRRGEIAGFASNIPTEARNIDSGLIKPLFVLATKRDPMMPDVPAITELATITGDSLELIKLWETLMVGSTIFVVSPGTPQDRLASLRGQFENWSQNEGFQGSVNMISGFEMRPEEYTKGEDVARLMGGVADTVGQYQDIFKEMIEKYRA